MTDPVAKPPTVTPQPKPQKKKKSKFTLTTKHIKSAAPFVRAGLALAGRAKKLRPYTQLLGEIVSIGAEALPDKKTQLMAALKKQRQLILDTDTQPCSEMRGTMDEIIDELLKLEP